MCYSFDEYCDSESNTVESCFPSQSDPLEWCRRHVQGLETPINTQCQFACSYTFNTSQLYPEEPQVEKQQEFMDTKGVIIVVLSCLLVALILLHFVRCFCRRRRRREQDGYNKLSTDNVELKLEPNETKIPVTEEGGEVLQVIVKDGKDDRQKETMERHEGIEADKRNVTDAPAPGDVSLVGSRLSGEQRGRTVEADNLTGRETQAGANRPAPGSQEVLNGQNNIGTTLRQSAENIDGNASRHSLDGSPQFSNRSQSFSSAQSDGSHSSGASSSSGAQASGSQGEHPADTEHRQKRAWHSSETNEHPTDDKEKHKFVPNGKPYELD